MENLYLEAEECSQLGRTLRILLSAEPGAGDAVQVVVRADPGRQAPLSGGRHVVLRPQPGPAARGGRSPTGAYFKDPHNPLNASPYCA